MPRTSVQLTVSLPPDLYRRAMEVARQETRSKSDMVREALREFVTRRAEVVSARTALASALRRRGMKDLGGIERLVDADRA